jgi:hypothetical protein
MSGVQQGRKKRGWTQLLAELVKQRMVFAMRGGVGK